MSVEKDYGLGFKNPQFKWYALFGWGCPFLVTIITLIMEFHPEIENKPFGTTQQCYLAGKSRLYYVELIVAPILVGLKNAYFCLL